MNGRRLVIVGYGAIAEKHAEVFRALGCHLVAACNRSPANRQRAQSAGVPRTYADAVEMVERERPDGILVCASALAQFEVARRLIPLRVPILLEKPPGTSVEETMHLAQLADAHGTAVMVGLNRRFYSVYQQGLDVLGGRSAITQIAVEWSEEPILARQKGHPAPLLPLLTFANSLHGLDLLHFWGGPVSPTRVWGRDLDPGGDQYRWQMTLDGQGQWGAAVHFRSTWDAPGRWRLVVDAWGARLTSAPLETATVLRRGSPELVIEPSDEDRRFKPGFYGQAQRFLDVLAGQADVSWPACSLHDALGPMQLAARLTEACQEREPLARVPDAKAEVMH